MIVTGDNASKEYRAEVKAVMAKADRVISLISHDLKSPMVAITGFTALLKDQVTEAGSPQRWITLLDRIERAAIGSLAMVEDILALAKTEAGKEPVESVWVDNLEMELIDLVETFRMEAEAKGMNIRLEAVNLPPVKWDIRRIRYHVINNIISNALKFTPAGGEVIVAAHANSDKVVIEIRDSGPGVPVAERERIFERFEQADLKTSRVFNGSGLGLANAAIFVKRHGGRIDVRDAKPHGAVFMIELPIDAGGEDETMEAIASGM